MWGHKITVSIYVEGPPEKAEEVIDCLSEAALPTIDFMGVAVAEVQDEPRDQGR